MVPYSGRLMHVEIIKCIAYGPINQEENVFLHRIFDLPFAPFEGLKVIQGDWSEEVDSVEWDVDEAFFTCWTENDETYLGQFVDEDTLRALVAEYVAAGWEESPHEEDPDR